LFGLYGWNIGDWNYMGGIRKTFYGYFPLKWPELTFERIGIYHSADITYEQEHYINVRTVVQDLFYYFVGRYAGIAWYFPPTLVGLVMALRRPRGRSVWLLVGLGLMAAAFIVSQPHNYLGGSRTIANRYFLCVYPWTFVRVCLRNGPIAGHRVRIRFGAARFRFRLESWEERTIDGVFVVIEPWTVPARPGGGEP